MKPIIWVLFLGIVVAEVPPYRPRGWRPSGQQFNAHQSRMYGPPPASQAYGPPPEVGTGRPIYSPIPTTASTDTTVPPTTEATTTTTTTTTEKSREPTTPSGVPEEDFENNPALAVANAFAINRPIYVYNSFPFYSGYTIGK